MVRCHAYYVTLCSIYRSLGHGGRIKARGDAVVALNPEAGQLPALAALLKMTVQEFRVVLAKDQSGGFKTVSRTVKYPERAIRVCNPALWRQM
jgi:hypothetical protein